MRTNVEIEEAYLEAIMDRYGVRTKTQAIDLALRHLVGQPMTSEGHRDSAEPPATTTALPTIDQSRQKKTTGKAA